MSLRTSWRALWITAALTSVSLGSGCSKDLPSSPGTPAGTPVIMNGQPLVGISRNISFRNGTVLNQSGRTIYRFRVALVVWRDAPFNAQATDTSEVKLDSVVHGDTKPFSPFETMGDVFIDAFPVYDIIP